ncbi:hypothetical protein BXU11_12080 [Flavobacterium sp. LM5]|nr:hypothetical protein BXU11_12080 [Flavobacterium sp. LM5]
MLSITKKYSTTTTESEIPTFTQVEIKKKASLVNRIPNTNSNIKNTLRQISFFLKFKKRRNKISSIIGIIITTNQKEIVAILSLDFSIASIKEGKPNMSVTK